MISFDEAIELVRQIACPLGTEQVPIGEAHRRVLGKPIYARVASPPSDVSAMDGYAVRQSDLNDFPLGLSIVGESFAGAGFDGSVEEGRCVRIFTGAPLPVGADRVVIQEMVRREGDTAFIDNPLGSGRHVRPRASDFAGGDELLGAGSRLDFRGLVTAAGGDHAELTVWKRPRLFILSTGDELVAPGTALGRPGAIPESVSFGIKALAEDGGAQMVGRSRLPDHLPTMEQVAAEAAASADLVVVTGGASVGEKDFAKKMFEPLGLEILFSKVAMKPGKPVWLGRVGETLVMGLPGNPTSALVTARLLLSPLIAGLSGRDPKEVSEWFSLPLDTPLDACGDRETFVRARLIDGRAEPISNQDSSAQKTLAEARLLLRRRALAPAAAAREMAEALHF